MVNALVLTRLLWLCPAGTNTPLSNELCAVALTSEEVELAEALLGRVAKLAAAASEKNVRLMIDAEHTYFQPVSPKPTAAHDAVSVLLCAAGWLFPVCLGVKVLLSTCAMRM